MAKQEEMKDFDEEMDLASLPGHTFKLAGRTWHTKGYAPPAAFLDSDDSQRNLAHFVTTLLVAEDREAFTELMKDPDAPVDFKSLAPISGFIMEKLSGRPTASPGSSGNGAGRTSSGSKENSSSQDVTTGA